MANDKIPTLEDLDKEMNGKFGKGTIGTLSDDTNAQIDHWTSTGIYGLDDAMGWGLPGGRIVEFFGAESSGKTTAMMGSFIENERNGGINFCNDGEGTFDRDRYKQMGGNPDTLRLIYSDTLEEWYDKQKALLRWSARQTLPPNAVILIGTDSMPMLIPADVLALKDEEQTVGSASRVNSRHLPTIDKMLPGNTCMLLLNQVRDKIGAMAWTQEGNIDTPGGRIIKHLSSVRVLFNKAGQIDNGLTKEKRMIIGMKTEAKVVKNKIGPPFRKAAFRVMFDHRGVDNAEHCLQAFVAKKLIPAPVLGVYTVKGMSFKKDEFYKVVRQFPKWTAASLEQTFELFHDSINIERYIGKKVAAVD